MSLGAIYGLEDADGVRALVLELVEGETLADRIARGPIPLNDTLTIARQIADALEAAHEKGIVHRDLKPANIKITPDGVVKVLDFGLAKAASGDAVTADLTQSPTITVGGTKEGVILGTATYMSPEQAKGRPADKRADVWAFGVVLYEMLTGRRAFEGEAISEVLAKVIEREPDWTALPASTPPRLRELLRRCVRKDPKTRLQAIGDARVQIDELISGATEETAAVVATQPRAQRSARLAWSVAALSLVIAAALAVPATWYFRRAAPEPACDALRDPHAADERSGIVRAVGRRPAAGVRRDVRGRVAALGAAARPGDGAAARGHRGSPLSVLEAGWPRDRVFCRRQAEEDRFGKRRSCANWRTRRMAAVARGIAMTSSCSPQPAAGS